MSEFDLGTARGRIEIDDSGLAKTGALASTTASKFGAMESKMAGHIKAAGRNLSQLGKIMSIGVTLPFLALGKVAVDELTQFNQVQGQTKAALKSTGSAAGVSLKHIDDLSASLGRLTATDGEVVQGAENILLTFPQVRNEVGKGNNIFDQASLSIQNLAARMGGDAQGSAIQLGKALSNPIKGISALTRVGVVFDDVQKKQIARFVEQGKTVEAQKIILGELNKEFGGSAKAMGDAASPLTKLNLLFRDFAQQIGPFFVAIVQKILGVATSLAKKFEGLSPSGKKMILTILTIAAVIGPLIIIVGKFVTAIGAAGKAIISVTKLFAANPWLLLALAVIAITILIVTHWSQIVKFLTGVWHAIFNTATTIWNGILSFFKAWGPLLLAILTGGISLVITAIVTHWNQIVAITTAIWNGIIAFFKSWGILLLLVLTGGLALIPLMIIKYWNEVKAVTIAIWNVIKAVLTTIWRVLSSIARVEFNIIKTVVVTIFNAMRGPVLAVWNVISAGLRAIWTGIKATATTAFNALKTVALTIFNALRVGILKAVGLIQAPWKAVWTSMASVASGIWGGIESAFKFGVNAVISIINGLIRAYNFIPFHNDIPTIPHLQRGTRFFPGGFALVGESGPELAVFPRGTQVIPAQQTRGVLAGLSGGDGGAVNNWQVVVNNPIAETSEESMTRTIRKLAFLGLTG